MQSTNEHLLRSTVKLVAGHAFRTPMNAIYGFANLMYTDAENISATDRKAFSLHILQSAEQLMNISDRVARWFDLKNRIKMHTGSCCLTNEFLIETITADADRYLTEGQGFMYASKVPELKIRGSKETIVPALKELFNNAFKFSADNTLPSILLYEEDGNYHIRISNFSSKASSADLKTYTTFTGFKRGGHEGQGIGLGLEIAGLGIKQCGGTLDIMEDPDAEMLKKIVIEVVLPVNN